MTVILDRASLEADLRERAEQRCGFGPNGPPCDIEADLGDHAWCVPCYARFVLRKVALIEPPMRERIVARLTIDLATVRDCRVDDDDLASWAQEIIERVLDPSAGGRQMDTAGTQ